MKSDGVSAGTRAQVALLNPRRPVALGLVALSACSKAGAPPEPPVARGEPLRIEAATGYDQMSRSVASLAPLLAAREGTAYVALTCRTHPDAGIEYKYHSIPPARLSESLATTLSASTNVPLNFITVHAEASIQGSYEYNWQRTGFVQLSRIPSRRDLDGSDASCKKATHVALAIYTGAASVRRTTDSSASAGAAVATAAADVSGSTSSAYALELGKTQCPEVADSDCRSPVAWTLVPLVPGLGASCSHVATNQEVCNKCEYTLPEGRSHALEPVARLDCANLPRAVPLDVNVKATIVVYPRYPDHAGQRNGAALEVTTTHGITASPKVRDEYDIQEPINFFLSGTASTDDGNLGVTVSTPKCSKGDGGSQCVVKDLKITVARR